MAGIQGHAVAEAPTGVARALLYIVRASPSFLLHPSYKTFYHTFHQKLYRSKSLVNPITQIPMRSVQ